MKKVVALLWVSGALVSGVLLSQGNPHDILMMVSNWPHRDQPANWSTTIEDGAKLKARRRPMSTHLRLIRHGQTEDNLAGRLTGWTDSALSPVGREQAEDLAAFLVNDWPIDIVYTSSLRRAAQTARAITRRLGIEPTIRDDLREFFLGDCEGLTMEEVEDRFPGLLESGRRLEDLGFRWPQGESRGDFYARVHRAFAEITTLHAGQSIVVVSHSAVLSTYLAQAIDGEPWHWPKYQIDNCALADVTIEEGKVRLGGFNVRDFLRSP